MGTVKLRLNRFAVENVIVTELYLLRLGFRFRIDFSAVVVVPQHATIILSSVIDWYLRFGTFYISCKGYLLTVGRSCCIIFVFLYNKPRQYAL